MLSQEQFQVPTMTCDLEQARLTYKFLMRDEGTCGNATGYLMSMF